MPNYYFNWTNDAQNIDLWFDNHIFIKIKDPLDIGNSIFLSPGDLIFVHASVYLFWITKAIENRGIDFVLMSRAIGIGIKREDNWTDNIHICRYPAHEFDKFDRVARFFSELSSGKRLWNLLIPDSKPNLIALTILCQGYIAAHVELSDTNGEIKKALERMGWDRVSPELQTKVKGKQKDVMEASWWQVFGDNAVLWETIKSEWDEGWTDDSDVAQLVKMILSNEAVDKTVTVAKAYIQLTSKLGK